MRSAHLSRSVCASLKKKKNENRLTTALQLLLRTMRNNYEKKRPENIMKIFRSLKRVLDVRFFVRVFFVCDFVLYFVITHFYREKN